MRILGLHVRNSKNAGDRFSNPLDYFEFPGDEVKIADMREPPDVRPDVVIYGGGSIITSPDFRKFEGAKIVAWGVGHHERARPWHDAMAEAHKRAALMCELYFPRDAIAGFDQGPCASCMHPAFDAVSNPVHEVVRYSAARRVIVDDPAEAPHMSNEDSTIEDAIRFLASGRTVITSSYHGAYWAGLLGRKVKLVPWGSKFEYLPNLSLAQCRDANRAVYRRVLQLTDR